MKNAVIVTIDSFLFSKIGTTKYGVSPTPFLDKLIKRSVFAKNLYSQGPYTEAGNKALLTGSDSLTHGGYMHNLNESDDIYLDVFKDNGYHTVEFLIPYYLYSSKHFKTIDKQFFTSDFVFNSVWSNRLKHFSEIKEKESLSEADYRDITEQLRLTFEAWHNYLSYSDNSRYKYIERLVRGYDFKKHEEFLKAENERFDEDPIGYANEVLKEGSDHKLFSIPLCDYSNFIDDDFLNKNIYKRHDKLIKQIVRKQFLLNIRNQKISLKRLAASFFNKDNHYIKSLTFTFASGLLAKQYKKKSFCQLLPSCRMLLRGVANEMVAAGDKSPIMVHVHPEELHNRTSFLTYDINDSKLLDHEFSLFENYMKNLKSNYKGEIIYDLALIYVDDCIKELYESLDSKGLLNNTVLTITSDHGYSYDCVPLREAFVNNHHTENYHIPAIIYDGEAHKGDYSEYHTSKDVLPTIYELCGIKAPNSINGTSILQDNGNNKYAISEYIGGGCPDMRRRPIQYMIRDDRWLLVYYVKLKDKFRNGEIVELYDLKKDIDEMNNLKGKVNEIEYSYLLEALSEHHLFLQNNQ